MLMFVVDTPSEESLYLIFLFGKDLKQDIETHRLPPGIISKLLANSITRLFACGDEQKSLRLKISDLRRLPVDEINAIARSSEKSFSSEFTSSQRQQWAGRELRRNFKVKNDEMLSLLFIIEHSLLLLWRYLQYIQGPAGVHEKKLLDMPQDSPLEKLRTEVRLSLTKLGPLQLTADMVSNDEARNAFIQMLVRKLKDIV
ncbi:hypothetical protein BC829DRAFT_216004 [Chytridium lagenaria]|nr:hypothetical protein BC829DRAFT_216004 [Chytridium lagenaria]